ncbi:MAG: ABC transporter ATP-binding protein [Mycoplasmoidaceae bacterium]
MEKIVFKNVSLGYTKDVNIVKDVSLSIKQGDFVSIIGVNGSGKSTLLFALFSMVNQNSGEIFYDGVNLKSLSRKYISKKIAFVPQLSTFPEDVTVWEFVQLGRHPYNSLFFSNKKEDDIKIKYALESVGLSHLKNEYIDKLSGGQRQRALIALTLAQDTETIVLDEPTNHLDIKAQLEIMHLLHDLNHRLNKTIIIVIHDINHGLKFSDKVIIMKDGKVALEGKTNNIITKKSIEEIFGVTPKIIKSHNKKIIYDYWINDLKSPNDYPGHDTQKK